MAEQSPMSLPKHLKSPAITVNAFVEFFHTPQSMLAGYSLKELFQPFDISEVWMVGSRIWRPTLGLPCPEAKDIDLVFGQQGAALDFVGNAYAKLSEKTNAAFYAISECRVYGGHKLSCAMTGAGIIDAWDLISGQSIAEHISGFRHPHERVAVAIGACANEVTAVTRLVRPEPANQSVRHVQSVLSNVKPRPNVPDYGS